MSASDLLILSPTYARFGLAAIVLATAALTIVNLLRRGRPHLARALFSATVAFVAVFPQVTSYLPTFPAASILTIVVLYASTVALVWLFIARPQALYRPPLPPPQPSERFLW